MLSQGVDDILNSPTPAAATTSSNPTPAPASASAAASSSSSSSSPQVTSLPPYYRSQLFNELYFLADGGTVWTDTAAGATNTNTDGDGTRTGEDINSSGGEWPSGVVRSCDASGKGLFQQLLEQQQQQQHPLRQAMAAVRLLQLAMVAHDAALRLGSSSSSPGHSSAPQPPPNQPPQPQRPPNKPFVAAGDQRLVGQFLYLEGHEYLMYNTYDVHFYR